MYILFIIENCLLLERFTKRREDTYSGRTALRGACITSRVVDDVRPCYADKCSIIADADVDAAV